MSNSAYNPTYGGAGGGGGGGYQTGSGMANSLTDNSILASFGDPLGFAGMGGGTWWDPGNIFGTVRAPNPAESGMPYLDQIAPTISPYYQPYIDAGQQALGGLMGEYGGLMDDPAARMNQIGSSFQQSPGYGFQYDQGMNAANAAAGAGGMAGTPAHQQQASTMASNLANQDYNNYLGNATGYYNQGLQGMSGINQMGYGASNELAQSLMSALMSQGGMAYAGQESANAEQGGITDQLMSIGGSVMGAFSDVRLKKDIEKVGEKNGHNIYHFKYIDAPEKTWEGVMAQEVEKIMPEAVKTLDGYLHVNYEMLGLKMKEVK
jgi:hypothetical protein